VLIVDCILDDEGWSPIHQLVALASRLFEARILRGTRDEPSLRNKLLGLLRSRRKRSDRQETCLLIGQGPSDLKRVLRVADWHLQFGTIAAWIIDSFWVDHIPLVARLSPLFNHFFVTSLEDIPQWRQTTGVTTTWLPWGTDALDLGSGGGERPLDILRLGRQPTEWEDDLSNLNAARALNLTYQGRIPGDTLTALENQRLVMHLYGSTKYLIAFSNIVNPGNQTHPKREYLTGRWVDALAGGAIVAGIAPKGEGVDRLLWDGATLELGSIRRQQGLEIIADALKKWTPAIPKKNHLMALKNLDWRWRLKILAETLSAETPTLRAEIARLSARINSLETSLVNG